MLVQQSEDTRMTAASSMTRRALLGVGGVALAGATVGAWPRLTASDIPGRGDDVLTVAIQGTSQDAAKRQQLVDEFRAEHPDIPVRIQAVQSADWGDFFSKILTMVAAGQAPDLVYVATEGTQLFADRLAVPLDSFVQRDAATMGEYFRDVHPSLVEAFMYKGNLYQLPLEFNAANMYLNTAALRRAGAERPADDWTKDDFTGLMRAMQRSNEGSFRPYYWTNRMFGGVVPWLYANGTSFLTEEKAPGGGWLWNGFYGDHPAGADRSGGYLWTGSNVRDERVTETFDYLRELVQEGLGVRPEEGGGNALIGLFASNRVGATPAGGYWAQGLNEAGMGPEAFDVQFFPRWRTQRHQFGGAGYALMKTSERKDQAWEWIKFTARKESMQLATPHPNTTPSRRSMVTADFYRGAGPEHWQVFYDTLDRFPSTGPIPAPPQQAAVESALMKNVAVAMGGGAGQMTSALDRLDTELALILGEDS